MEKEDYLKLHELLAKIDILLAEDCYVYGGLDEKYLKNLKDLQKGVNLVRNNIYVKIEKGE